MTFQLYMRCLSIEPTNSEDYLEPSRKSMKERFAEIVND